MESIELVKIERRKNKKGQQYYAICYGNGAELFNALEEALAQVGNIAKFVDSIESLPQNK